MEITNGIGQNKNRHTEGLFRRSERKHDGLDNKM